MADHWLLDPNIAFLNHGSFGACPRPVLQEQDRLRAEMEREPVIFFVRELEGMLDLARTALATFVGADPQGLVFVPNATAGINAVLRSLDLRGGDEVIVTDQEYNASRNALEYAAGRAGASVTVVEIPFPIDSPETVVDRVLEAVSARTRLVLIDHVTSQTALVFPVARLVAELSSRGIETLVDGAHAPGMLDLNVGAMGTAWYTGNLHKWVCAPKGAGFLAVREDLRDTVRPIAISHGASSERRDRSRFLIEFDWTGTWDPTPYLSVPAALRFFEKIVPGGWPEVRRRNAALAREGRNALCAVLAVPPPAPDSMLGSMAAIPLPDSVGPPPPPAALYGDPLQDALLERHRIEVPIIAWPAWPRRLVRISAQLYNERQQYESLGAALRAELP